MAVLIEWDWCWGIFVLTCWKTLSDACRFHGSVGAGWCEAVVQPQLQLTGWLIPLEVAGTNLLNVRFRTVSNRFQAGDRFLTGTHRLRSESFQHAAKQYVLFCWSYASNTLLMLISPSWSAKYNFVLQQRSSCWEASHPEHIQWQFYSLFELIGL